MADSDVEIPLSGGNSSGLVVRVGDSVRKTTKKCSSTVHRLLEFLEAEGFSASPRFLGTDDKNREILSYLDGSCEITPEAWRSSEILQSSAHLLRDLHDTTARYQPSDDDQWSYTYPDKTRHEVICHNDFGLYNLVVKDGRCCGIIDFDLAGPGPRLRDVAYAAYWMVPLSLHADDMKPHSDQDIENGSARLKLFCKTYGLKPDKLLLDMVSEVLHYMGDDRAMTEAFGKDITATLMADGHLDHWSMEAIAFDRHRTGIECNLL